MNWKAIALSVMLVGCGTAQGQGIDIPDLPNSSATPAYQQPQQVQSPIDVRTWTRVGVPNVFSALMPGAPRRSDTAMQGATASHWSSDTGEPMHMFAIEMQYCGRVSGDNMDNMLFSLMSTRAKTVGAEPVHKRRIQNNASPGCMFDIVSGDSEWNFMIRVVGSNVVTMSVCSMPGQGNDEYAKEFFNSFSM